MDRNVDKKVDRGKEHSLEKKHPSFLWLSSSTNLLGLIIAVVLVVTGGFIVFSYSNTRENSVSTTSETPKKVTKKKEERLNEKNANKILRDYQQKIDKALKRADTNSSMAQSYQRKEKIPLSSGTAAAKGTTAIQVQSLKRQATTQTDVRINELWQSLSVVELTTSEKSSKQRIKQKINKKIAQVASQEKVLASVQSVDVIKEYYTNLQEDQVYNCYLPNINRQIINDDFQQVTKEHNKLLTELDGLNKNFNKKGVKTNRLTQQMTKMQQQLSKINTGVTGLSSSVVQAENTNCEKNPSYNITPIKQDLTDLKNLDEQIRQQVDQILKESMKNIPTKTVKEPTEKVRRKDRVRPTRVPRERRRVTESPENPDEKDEPTQTPDESEDPEPTDSEDPEEEPETTPEPSRTPPGDIDFQALGLPQPIATGTSGYKELLYRFESDEKAAWAARSLLDAEANAEDKGIAVKRYLTTAWIWFENGAAAWPDPYEVNCNDNRPGYVSEVHFYCGAMNFQVGGYQAAYRSQDYVKMYQKFYEDDELVEVLKKVIENSDNAVREDWNYNADSQQKGLIASHLDAIDNVTIKDISPNTSFNSEKGQFWSLVLGKDPNMAIALNTFAVSDSDLVGALKSGGCGYGYICATEKQILSNMVAALYLYDGGEL